MELAYKLGAVVGGLTAIFLVVLGARFLNARIGSFLVRILVWVVSGFLILSAASGAFLTILPRTEDLDPSVALIPPPGLYLVPSIPARERVEAALRAEHLDASVQEVEARQIWNRRNQTVGSVGIMALNPYIAPGEEPGFAEGLAAAAGAQPSAIRLAGHPAHTFRGRTGPVGGLVVYTTQVENLLIVVFGSTVGIARSVTRSLIQAARAAA